MDQFSEFEPFQEVVLVRLVLILGDTVKLGQDVVKRHLVKVKIMVMTMMSDIMRHDDDVSGNDDDGQPEVFPSPPWPVFGKLSPSPPTFPSSSLSSLHSAACCSI